jgi:hypothetical protein
MGPINYDIDVQTPFQSAMQGYQEGAAVRKEQEQRAQQQAATEQQRQMQTDLSELSKNPTTQALSAMSIKYPQLSEQFKRSYDMLGSDQQKNELGHATQVYAAVQSGRGDIAAKLLRDRATAMRNSGEEDKAGVSEAMAKLVEQHPESFKTTAGLMLSSVMGPDKFADTFGKLGSESRATEQAPADLAKKQAEATKSGVDAKYAEQGALLDLEKKGWDITNIREDIGIKKEANRIAAMNAAANRENNSLKREELGLKIKEARAALDDKVRAKAAEAESSAGSIDNSLNTIERIKNNPSLDSVIGSFQGRVPAIFSDEANDAIALIDTLGSQAFLSQVSQMKGQGALSDAEGKKLQSALTNLSRNQSEKQFRANLDDASRLLAKGRDNLAKKTGVPLSRPDTPAMQPSASDIDALVKKYLPAQP